MTYKAILLGIFLILSAPAVSLAQSDFSSKGSYEAFINSAINQLKQVVYARISNTSLDVTTTLTLANDAEFNDVIATLQMKDYFDTGPSTGAFSFVQDEGGNFGVFVGSFKEKADVVTSFTGTLTEIFADGSFAIITFKAKPLK
ncbi:MAG TPA: hypothetical protein VI231_02515 [Candidatus Binatia bacterium]